MISTQNLTKRFGPLVALDNLTLEIGPGEIFGFIGPNGAGKSTTMKVLACLLKQDSGEAFVCGKNTKKDADAIRRLVGYMPDFLGVYDDLTVDEYLQFFAAAFSVPRSRRRAVIDQVLELTDLTEKKQAMVDSLSRGMQQRLGVARVLIHEPQVLLLDEPASGLDPRARIEMRSLLIELRKMGKSLMVSSHILSELAEMCTSIGIVERGKLLYAGSIADAYAKVRSAALDVGGDGDPANASLRERIVVVLHRSSAPADAIAASLRGDSRIAAVSVESSTTLTVDLRISETDGHAFATDLLLAGGARIHSLAPAEIKLEDAFLKLTTGALH
ncbi:MAG: ABC transporter ATP-binding protein [Phycisphaeraceae bacterium]|nr:ABC transporter ATP-binding protein [Phycisphaeraceae bacterium]